MNFIKIIKFRILSDALTNIFINVAGLKIFLAVGEDWIVKKSIIPEEFTSFVKRFAVRILFFSFFFCLFQILNLL